MLLLAGCLVDTALYERRSAELTDADGDGYIAEDECDDGDASVYPGADERCDGLDQDCDGEVDEDAADVSAWYADADADGHGDLEALTWACEAPPGSVGTADDCDDQDAGVAPGLADSWYDGVDADCDGADDYDADADGDPSDQWGGTDCDDADPSVSGLTEEGWTDAGIDNNCDGSIEDQARAEAGELGVRVDGVAADGWFGASVLAVPAGWVDEEAVLLVAAPFAGAGDVYGWRASEVGGASGVASANWHLEGATAGDFFGFGMGWAGDGEEPLVVIGSEGAGGGLGEVAGWRSSTLEDSQTFRIIGQTSAGYFGAQVLSGHDHDGDGIDDVVATAQLDSRLAVNAGSAFLFLEPHSLYDEVSVADADLEFTTSYAGALLSVTGVGDLDGDGREDLGFSQDIPYPEGPGGLLVTEARGVGSYDVTAASVAQLHGGPFVLGRAWDPFGDGRSSLLAASGGLHAFPLPLEGSITPWDDAERSLEFAEAGSSIRWIRTDAGDYAGDTSFVIASSNFGGSAGMLSVQAANWIDGDTVDESRFFAVGDAAGDQASYGLDVLDWDDDGVIDLVIGAPGADEGGSSSGSVYLVRGPR